MPKLGFCLITAALCGAACAANEPAHAPDASAASQPTATESEAKPAAAAEAPTSEPTAETPAPAPTAPPPEPTLRARCEATCQKVAEKCSASIAQSCKTNCDQYDRLPKPCEPYAREALDCAQSAKDLQCANIAPESCSKLYRRTAECLRAPESVQVKGADDATKAVPAGWERHQDQGAGFAALMPKGVTQSQSGTESQWAVSVGDVRYVIRKLPPLTEKFTPKSQVRLASDWLKPCTLKLKIHGQLEKGDRTSVHYDAGCKDGSERHGMVHMTPKAVFIVGIEAPAGRQSDLEPFIYGFELN